MPLISSTYRFTSLAYLPLLGAFSALQKGCVEFSKRFQRNHSQTLQVVWEERGKKQLGFEQHVGSLFPSCILSRVSKLWVSSSRVRCWQRHHSSFQQSACIIQLSLCPTFSASYLQPKLGRGGGRRVRTTDITPIIFKNKNPVVV